MLTNMNVSWVCEIKNNVHVLEPIRCSHVSADDCVERHGHPTSASMHVSGEGYGRRAGVQVPTVHISTRKLSWEYPVYRKFGGPHVYVWRDHQEQYSRGGHNGI